MQEFLTQPWVIAIGWILGAIGWMVGITAGLIQFKSYSEQRAMEKGYLEILEQAKKDWVGKYTEEQVEALSRELASLQEKIERDVPREARRVFLESRLHDLSNSIGENYVSYEQLVEELELAPSKQPLAPELKATIEASILPAHLSGKREIRRLQWLLGIAVLLLVFVNWDNFMSILHTGQLSLGGWRYEDRYPISWLIVYAAFVVAFMWLLNQTRPGRWLRNHLNSDVLDGIRTTKGRGRLRSIIREISFMTIMTIGMFVILIAVPTLPSLFVELTKETANPRYDFEGLRPMPLSSVPLTVCLAFPLSVLLLSLFYFFFNGKLPRLRSLVGREKK